MGKGRDLGRREGRESKEIRTSKANSRLHILLRTRVKKSNGKKTLLRRKGRREMLDGTFLGAWKIRNSPSAGRQNEKGQKMGEE